MKTSKKLLSFFLAVVMVVTTCSVGFTAFAKDNNSIWSTTCEAEDAFNTLDALASKYLPSVLLNIEAVGKPIYERYAKEHGKTYDELTDDDKAAAAAETTLSDALAALQPTLLGLLAKTSQSDFVDKYFPGTDASKFDYLNERTATMSYFSLVKLCDDYRNSKLLSDEQKATLQAYYDALMPLAQLATSVTSKVELYGDKYTAETGEDYKTAALTILESYDFGLTDEDKSFFESLYPSYQNNLKEYGVPEGDIVIDSFPKLLYYFFGGGKAVLSAYQYYNLIKLTGCDVTFQGKGDLSALGFEEAEYNITEDITPSNVVSVILQATFESVNNTDYLEEMLGVREFNNAREMVAFLLTGESTEISDEEYDYVLSLLEVTVSQNYLDIILPSHYSEAICGIAISEGAISSMAEFESIVASKLPGGQLGIDSSIFNDSNDVAGLDINDEDINVLAHAMSQSQLASAVPEVEKFFAGEEATFSFALPGGSSQEYKLTLPQQLKDTYVADYFNLVTSQSNEGTYKDNIIRAFFPKYGSSNGYISNNGGYTPAANGRPEIQADKNPIDTAQIDKYLADAESYAYSKAVSELTGIEGTIIDSVTKQPFLIDVNAYLASKISDNTAVKLTDEQKAILNDNYDIANDIGTIILNDKLNGLIVNLLSSKLMGDATIEDMINNLLVTNCDIITAVNNIWSRLVNAPVKTIVELLPVVTVLLDELILPFIANGKGDQYYDALYGVLSDTLIKSLIADGGSYVGITHLSWDLNKLLPNLMHWLRDGAKAENIDFYNLGTVEVKDVAEDADGIKYFADKRTPAANVTADDLKHYTAFDQDGNELVRNVDADDNVTYTYKGATNSDLAALLGASAESVFTYYMTYESNVPVLTGIYIADRALRDAELADLPKLFNKLLKGNETLANGLSEIVVEFATLFTAAVDEFVATPALRNATRYDTTDQQLGSGLNNIFVALPQLFDILENLAAEKYGVDKDAWIYCYNGKITTKPVTENHENPVNKDFEEFKSFAGSDADDRSYDIFDCFAGIFVEQWLNAIVSLFNNLIDKSSLVEENLPIVSGLFRALGGFGPDSIFTDVFNSIFQQKRGDKYSFEFEPSAMTGLTGLDKDNAYFLITNIETLIDVIIALIDSIKNPATPENPTPENPTPENPTPENPTPENPTPENPTPEDPTPEDPTPEDPIVVSTFNPSNYTAEELSTVNGVITSLDEMLSSLLSDSSINGYGLDNTGNIAAGLVSFLSNYISESDATALLGLLDSYLYYLNGAGARSADENGNMKAEEVYTNDNLTDLIVRTFALIESISESLLAKFDYKGKLDSENNVIKYNLIARAIEGIISPDAIGIRLDDYDDAQAKITKLTTWNDAIGADGKVSISIDWKVANGDNEAFFGGLASAMRLVTTILGVLIVDTGWYETIVYPVLTAICERNGVKVDTPAEFAKLADGKYRDEVLLGLIRPISDWLNKLLAAPATTLINSLQGLTGLLDDTSGTTIADIVTGAITPLKNEILGAANILNASSDRLGPISSTLAEVVTDFSYSLAFYAEKNDKNELVNISIKGLPLSGSNIIPIINKLLSSIGIKLNNINWNAISNAKSPAEYLAFLVEYLVNTVKSNDNIDVIVGLIAGNGEVSSTLQTVISAIKSDKLTGKGVFILLSKVLKLTKNPTLFAWSFEQYLLKLVENFSYPLGLTKTQADQAAENIDKVVNSVFPLLQQLGVLNTGSLSGLVNGALFKNELLTKLAVALYGALDGNDTIKMIMSIIGVPTSTADVAAILNDTSYGATFSTAAQTIAAKASWNELKTVTKDDKGNETTTYAAINWGFTDGAANAQQGFVNALVAILRPLNDILAVFLNSQALGFNLSETITNAIAKGEVKTEYLAIGDGFARLTITNTGSQLNINVMPVTSDGAETPTYTEVAGAIESVIVVDFKALDDISIYGTNAYNSAIIPLLEAFQCEGIVSEAQYKTDIAKAKDALLLDILNPIIGGSDKSLVNKVLANPITEICTLLPNVAAFIDAHGLSQLVANLIAPITNILYAANDTIDIGAIIVGLLGQPAGTSLGDAIGALIGVPAGVLNVDLSDLSTLNIEAALAPIVNKILSGITPAPLTDEQKATMKAEDIKKYEDKAAILKVVSKIRIADINFAALTAFGDKVDYTSLATDVNGNALTGKKVTNVDYGKVLITVLRYVLNTVIANADTIGELLGSIQAISSNATIKSIVNNVVGQIKTHTADQLIVAIYYFLIGNNTSDYWDYTKYTTKASTYKLPDGVSADDVTALITFIDGIVKEIDLNSLISKGLYTDSIVNALAKAIYQGIGGVKLGESLKLDTLLSALGIGLTPKAVAALLTDASYGETAQFKSAAAAIATANDWSAVDFTKLSWGVKDQGTFLKALVAVLRPLAGVLDTILADGKLNLLEGVHIPGSNGYESTIVPLLEALGCKNLKSYNKYLEDKSKAKDALLLDILEPLFGFVNDVITNPIETLAGALPNIALFIGNDGLVQLIENLVTPIIAIVKDINPLIDVDKLLVDLLKNVDASKFGIDLTKLSVTNLGGFLATIVGGKTLIPFVNNILAGIKVKDKPLGIKINDIDWLELAAMGTASNADSVVKVIGQRIVIKADTSKVLVAVLEFVLGTVLKNAEAIKGLIGDKYTGTLKDILDMIFALDAKDLLALVFRLVNITQSSTEVYWSYKNYKSKTASFKYPDGITAKDAADAIAQLDGAVGSVFALLGGLGVVDADDLSGLVNGLLFKNEMITKLAKTLYGALDNEKIAPYLEGAGIPVSTTEVAKLLKDKSYGATYSSAAKTIAAAKSWDKVGKVNWGFTDGAANAQQGFVNALVAVLRPVLNILGPFLNGENLALGEMVYGIIVSLDINSGDKTKGENLVTFKNGVLKIEKQTNGVYSTALELNLANITTLKDLNICSANGYENTIIPLLDVLQVDNSEIKTYDEYVKDCKKAKDNILLDVLNPLMSFINRVLEAPFDTITGVLPNLAYFIDNNGIGQLLNNLLSPITEFLKDAKKHGVDVDDIITTIVGKDLGSLVTELLKVKGVKLNITVTDLASCNIQEIVVPLINSLLKKTGIKLPDFKWSTIASHGKVVTSKSQAENAEGKFTNKEVIADKGETLVAVLRYVAKTLVNNSKTLKNLLCGIDAIKKNDMISSIIKSVFNTIGASSADSIVRAVFYFLKSEPTNAFWDYTAYETGEYDFSYPESVDQDFLVNLPPMLDGLIGGLLESKGGLNGLIGGLIFKDDIISALATGLYGAIEGVKINDGTNLAQLLALTNIDFTTEHVAKLLVNEKYGQTYSSAASVIAKAGSWANVNKASLKWGVTDRDSFFHALAAVLRPIYGVLDVLLNDASLGIFDIVRIPGSNGYTSSIVPLMEAFSMYNIKTQYQYREDIVEEYDAILLDIINPLWDKIEDILNAPLQTLAAMLPNLALFIGNDGLCQIINNLLTPVSALIDAIKPVVNLNDVLTAVLGALNVDLGAILGKIGVTNFNLDLYDLMTTLMPLLGGDAIIPLVNNVLGLIKIKGTPLGIKLNDVDWLRLASHGETIVSASQAATYGSRIFVEGDSSETLIAVLSYLIETVNAGDNFAVISGLIAGLLGDGVSESISGVIDQVLGMLQGDTDKVIGDLVGLLQTIA